MFGRCRLDVSGDRNRDQGAAMPSGIVVIRRQKPGQLDAKGLTVIDSVGFSLRPQWRKRAQAAESTAATLDAKGRRLARDRTRTYEPIAKTSR